MKYNRLLLFLLMPLCLPAQDSLTLSEAVQRALGHHPSLEAATARVHAAEASIAQARSGWMPHAVYSESFESGNNPVYVFGALLTQHQFTAANFDLTPLNRPGALNNFQSQLTIDQKVYDFGATRSAARAAELGRKMTEAERHRAELGVMAGVARAYHGVTLAEQGLRLAEEALKSAQADLDRAAKLRSAGLATDSDVLSVQVHLSAMAEQRASRAAELTVSRAALNDAIGAPLDEHHTLSTPLEAPKPPAGDTGELERRAVAARPEVAGAKLASDLASTQISGARSQYFPTIGLHGVLEADRQDFASKGGANWMFAASARWTLFDGNGTRAAVAEARHKKEAADATARQVDSAVRLEVRQSIATLDASRERAAATEASVAQAEESMRIIRNRYANGLATVTDLLRGETALVEAQTRRLAALYDLRVAAVQLEASTGTLKGDSDVLK
jgi:outer membrane protein TolC